MLVDLDNINLVLLDNKVEVVEVLVPHLKLDQLLMQVEQRHR
tara:strand:- start:30 stop:155 length:126 start_codon:yes stop_codon:yes gene_type:complete